MALVASASVLAYLLKEAGHVGVLDVLLASDGRVRGLSLEPNLFAAQCVGWLAVMHARGRDLNWTAKVGAIPILAATALSGTRAAWIALIAVGLYAATSRLRRGRGIVWVAILIATLLLAVVTLLPVAVDQQQSTNPILWRLAHLFDVSNGTGAYRLDLYKEALQDLQTSGHWILGNGLNAFPQFHPIDPTGVGPSYLSSLWYELIYDTGALGLLLFILTSILLLVRFRTYRIFPVLVALLISASTTNLVWLAFPWMYLGLVVSQGRADRSEDCDTAATSSRPTLGELWEEGPPRAEFSHLESR